MAVGPLKPSFALVDHNGKAVTDADFHGKCVIVFFGFTHCKVICPRALGRLSEVVAQLGQDAGRVNVLYITVDPERDSPKVMKSFLSDRKLHFTGLTGTIEQIETARKSFRVYASPKVVEDDGLNGYDIPHTAITYLLGPDGQLIDHFNDALDTEEMVARIREKLVSSLGPTNNGTNSTANGGTKNYGKESLDLLGHKQVASMRHIGNLARQLKGDWSNMMGYPDLGESFGAYRFQIAYGFFALALAHFHRLPAAPGAFRSTMERMIKKIREPDCWFYWHASSQGGGIFGTPLSEPKLNPVAQDNIMYSAYLQTMALLYNSMFDDERYKKPGALTLEYDMVLWGPPGGVKFEYDQDSLNDRVYWNMVESGYLGVACEPYCVFQICNQVPILGFRLHDVLNDGKTHIAEEVTKGYTKAWEEFGGLLSPEGTFNTLVSTHNKKIIVVPTPGMDAWCGCLMNAWNSDFVAQSYEKMRDMHLKYNDDGTIFMNLPAFEDLPENQQRRKLDGEFWWVPAWAAEMGDEDTLKGLLAYTDKHFAPRIQNGGLMYPRNDTIYDDKGNFILTSPIPSNALLPLARLNVKNGFKRLYEDAWGGSNRAHYEEPALSDVDFSIDVYRAVYIAESRELIFDLAAYEQGARGSVVLSRIFGRGEWTLKLGGQKIAWGDPDQLAGSDPAVEIKQDGKTLLL